MENKIKHLEMIQSIITRMANNSFYIKGWVITLVSLLFAFSSKDNLCIFIILIIAPIFLFAALDVFYLQLERKYRNMYDDVRVKKEENIDFDLKLVNKHYTQKTKILSCIKSKSIWLFYLPLFIIVIGLIILLVRG